MRSWFFKNRIINRGVVLYLVHFNSEVECLISKANVEWHLYTTDIPIIFQMHFDKNNTAIWNAPGHVPADEQTIRYIEKQFFSGTVGRLTFDYIYITTL